MHEMDLIPAAFKQQSAQRQRRRWWALALGLLVLAAGGARLWVERGLAQERAWKAQWQPQQDKARAQRTDLKNLQTLIAQARAADVPLAGAAALAPIELLPALLATLPQPGLRLSNATLEATPDGIARLQLQGQAADETTLSQTVRLLQAHPHVAQVQLLGAKPEAAAGLGGQRFEMVVRVTSAAASAASAVGQP